MVVKIPEATPAFMYASRATAKTAGVGLKRSMRAAAFHRAGLRPARATRVDICVTPHRQGTKDSRCDAAAPLSRFGRVGAAGADRARHAAQFYWPVSNVSILRRRA